MKRCTKCGVEKPLSEFYVERKTGKVFSKCIPCNKAHSAAGWRKRKYGVTDEEYAERVLVCGGLCEACGGPPGAKALNVDHNHVTGQVRGLLCTGCNLMLGHMGDDPARLQALIDYLARYETIDAMTA